MKLDLGVAIGMGLSALVALGAPVAFAIFVRRRLGGTWVAWLIGAGTFFVSQVVLRMPWQIPLGVSLKSQLDAEPILLWGWIAFSSLTAGLFEETGRYVAFAKVLKQRTPANALMMGAGHGGIESMALVGVSILGNLVLYVMLANGHNPGIPAEQLDLVTEQYAKLTPGLALAGGVERLSSLAVHAGCSMLVFQCFARGPKRELGWLTRAIVFHTLVNLVGVGITRELGPLAGELAIALFAIAAATWTVILLRQPPPVPIAPPSEPAAG